MPLRRSVPRRTSLLALLAAFAALAGAVLALTSSASATAPPQTASFTTYDFGFTPGSGTGTTVTIAPGGTVSFSYPTGHSAHNVDFGSGPQPTSCTLTGGQAGMAPMPASPQGSGWSGSCLFDTPGTYTFHCDLHPNMTGTVVVSDTTSTPPAATTTTATMTMPMSMPMPPDTASTPAPAASTPATTSTPTTSGPMTGAAPGTAGSGTTRPGGNSHPAAGVRIPLTVHQHGATLSVAVRVPAAAAHAGARLTLLKGRTVLGLLTRSDLRAGSSVLTVRLNHAGMQVVHHLGRRAHLTLKLVAVFTTQSGRHVTSTAPVVVRHA